MPFLIPYLLSTSIRSCHSSPQNPPVNESQWSYMTYKITQGLASLLLLLWSHILPAPPFLIKLGHTGLPHGLETCQVCSTWGALYLVLPLCNVLSHIYLRGRGKCSSSPLFWTPSHSIICNIRLHRSSSPSFPHWTWLQSSSPSGLYILTFSFV